MKNYIKLRTNKKNLVIVISLKITFEIIYFILKFLIIPSSKLELLLNNN